VSRSPITQRNNPKTERVFSYGTASPSLNFLPTVLTASGRPRGVQIIIGSHCISKSYTNGDRIDHVTRMQSIYAVLKQRSVPNVDRLIMFHKNHERHGSVIYLQPRGMERLPELASEIIEATICVLQALLVRLVSPQSDLAH
jgi:hypothetical protein